MVLYAYKAITAIFLFPILLFATDFYIDPISGNDSNTGLSDAQAWQTWEKVVTYQNATGFNPGDNILIKRGTRMASANTVTFSGSAGNYITIGAYGSGAKPTIDGTGVNFCFWAVGRSYIRFQNLHLTKSTVSNIWLTDVTGVVVDSVVSDSSGNQAFQLDGISTATYTNIVGNHNTDDGFSMHDTTEATITNGTFNNNSQGINIVGDAHLTANNITILNSTTDAVALVAETAGDSLWVNINGLEADHRINIGDGGSATITRAYLHGYTADNYVITDIGIDAQEMHLSYCIFDTVGTNLFAVEYRSGLSSASFSNCIIRDNNGDGRGIFTQQSVDVINSMFIGVTYGVWHTVSETINIYNCLFDDIVTAAVNGTFAAITDTLMRDPLLQSDFTVLSTSPVIDAGKTVSGLSQDYFGNTVPSNSLFDIGVYEYQWPIAPSTATPERKYKHYNRWQGFKP